MAVARMLRATIVGHKPDQSALIEDLQEMGVIEISQIESRAIRSGTAETTWSLRIDQIESEISKVQFILRFIKSNMPSNKGVIAGLMPDRVVVSRTEFAAAASGLDFESIYQACQKLERQTNEVRERQKDAREQAATIVPWTDMSMPFAELKSFTDVAVIAGTISGNRLKDKTNLVETLPAAVDINMVGTSGEVTAVVAICEQKLSGEVRAALDVMGFEPAPGALTAAPAAELEILTRKQSRLSTEKRAIETAIKTIEKSRDELIVLETWLQAKLRSFEAQALLRSTANAFIIQGWIQKDRRREMQGRLDRAELVADFSFDEPQEGDRPPTTLKNWRIFRPLEVLTGLYGMPNYREADPTPIMGFFFLFFFGIALGDVGYGLVLTLFCLWLKRNPRFTKTGRRWLDLFALGGLSSMIVGIPTGSYFGIEISTLPEFLRRLVIIDPLEQAFAFLILTWVIGVVHVVIGMFIELRNSIKRRDYARAVYQDAGRIAVALSLVVSAVGWFGAVVFESNSAGFPILIDLGLKALTVSSIAYVLMSGNVITVYAATIRRAVGGGAREEAGRAGDITAWILALSMATALGRPELRGPAFIVALIVSVFGLVRTETVRRVLAGVGSGLYNLYSMSGFVGDILSYSRLMALGMATFLIGFVINTLAKLVVGATLFGLPVGILLALMIAIPLHTVNIAINLLGAFVHPLRLQFVEFFSQFYENGGEAFQSLSFDTDSLIISQEHERRREHGDVS